MCSSCALQRQSPSHMPHDASATSNDAEEASLGASDGARCSSSAASGDGHALPDDIHLCLSCGFVSCVEHMQQHCQASACQPVSMCCRTYVLNCSSCAMSPTTPCPAAAAAKRHIAALRVAAKTRDKLVMTPGRLVRAITSGLIGLKNGGNTCFANSVVQVRPSPPCFAARVVH